MVGLGRRVQPVDRVGGKADRGIEAEGVRRFDDVVVDGLGNADKRNAALVEPVSNGECAVAANYDQRV